MRTASISDGTEIKDDKPRSPGPSGVRTFSSVQTRGYGRYLRQQSMNNRTDKSANPMMISKA